MGKDGKSYAIRELASLAGVTPRAVRSWTSRGLVARPIGRARAARYNDEHLLRVRIIRKLRADGLALYQVRRYLRDHSPEQLAALVGPLPQPAPAPPAASPQASPTAAPSAAPPRTPVSWNVHNLVGGLVVMAAGDDPQLCLLAQQICDMFQPIALAVRKAKVRR